ncbi:hypothetical protein RUM44_005061 [Polyplax serrata]|uniref:Uncharacterized protein n=1 Tax=Polyplax serrata TaxID=468196 RepID=A0ABR1AWW7_POLSC
MIEKSVFTSLAILSMAGCIKAGVGSIKFLVLALAGLTGMYMMHLLAQDFNKYQALHSRPKRLISDVALPGDYAFSESSNTTSDSILRDIREKEQEYEGNELITLDRILRFDPTGCARRYVCTIATKSFKKRTQSEKNIIQMLRSLPSKRRVDSGQEAFNFAMNLGRRTKDAAACAEEYPKCIFSIAQMLKLVGIS